MVFKGFLCRMLELIASLAVMVGLAFLFAESFIRNS